MFVKCISSRIIYKYMTYPVLSWWNRVMWFLRPVVKVIPQIAFPEMLFVLITVIFKFECCWGNNLNRIIKVERKVLLLLLWSIMFQVVVGLCQGCQLSLILFVTSWTGCQGTVRLRRESGLGTSELYLCFFADDVVVLASLVLGQSVKQLGWESAAPSLKLLLSHGTQWIRDEFLSQTWHFKYLWFLFMSNVKKESEMDRR